MKRAAALLLAVVPFLLASADIAAAFQKKVVLAEAFTATW